MTFCPVLCGLLLWTRPSVSFALREIDKQPFCHVPPVRPNQTCKLFPRFIVRLNLHESKHNTFFFWSPFFRCSTASFKSICQSSQQTRGGTICLNFVVQSVLPACRWLTSSIFIITLNHLIRRILERFWLFSQHNELSHGSSCWITLFPVSLFLFKFPGVRRLPGRRVLAQLGFCCLYLFLPASGPDRWNQRELGENKTGTGAQATRHYGSLGLAVRRLGQWRRRGRVFRSRRQSDWVSEK